MRKAIVLLLLALSLPAMAQMPEVGLEEVHTCDLFFVVNSRGNAITASTTRLGQLPVDHVGIAFWANGEARVCEAIPEKGVTQTPLRAFLDRCKAENGSADIVVGRAEGLDSAATASRFLSIRAPYDSLYLPDNEAIYCSELVQVSFVDSLGRQLFESIPMSFHDESGQTLPYWTALYARHGMAVPEGAPGTNPGQLMRDSHVAILGRLKAE